MKSIFHRNFVKVISSIFRTCDDTEGKWKLSIAKVLLSAENNRKFWRLTISSSCFSEWAISGRARNEIDKMNKTKDFVTCVVIRSDFWNLAKLCEKNEIYFDGLWEGKFKFMLTRLSFRVTTFRHFYTYKFKFT